MVYRKKPDRLENPGPLIGEMRRCRGAAIRAASSAKSMASTIMLCRWLWLRSTEPPTSSRGSPIIFLRAALGPARSERARAARQGAFERGEGEL